MPATRVPRGLACAAGDARFVRLQIVSAAACGGKGLELHAVWSRFQPLDGRRYNSLLHVQRAAEQIRRGAGPMAPVAEARGRLQRLA